MAIGLSSCGSNSSTGGNGGSNPPPAISNQWTWVGGPNTIDSNHGNGGVYGTLGVASAANIPGSRNGASSWTDSSGNLWLFGGYGYSAEGSFPGSAGIGYLNDLWKYSPSAKTWTWVAGANNTSGNFGSPGIYGRLGVASAANLPGGRSGASTWTDAHGNLWLFGGYGFDSADNNCQLNDLWSFNPSTAMWTWVSGSDICISSTQAKGLPGVYGTLGVAGAGNMPGSRSLAATWTTADGTLWLFGGSGFDSTDHAGALNDLWNFNPSTGMWTWVSGSDNLGSGYSMGQVGVYGTQGVASASNVPGGREASYPWVDSSGRLWLFGGSGYYYTSSAVTFNDLWMYDPVAKTWTWVTGANTPSATGVYGTIGVAATANTPGARDGGVSWTDSRHNFWLFGGNSFNDLWKFSPSTGTWTWVGGSSSTVGAASYGTFGVASSTNIPGGRSQAVSWVTSDGNFWLFGGGGYDSTGNAGSLNDLWRYQP
jgi:N-acetylneuraminic acid mutarotase